jgi:ankyrin repeat protein
MPLLCMRFWVRAQALICTLFEEEKGHNIRVVGIAAHHESTECLQLLLEFKEDVNSQHGGMRTTALMAAAEYGRAECMRLLLEQKADVAIAEEYGETALS